MSYYDDFAKFGDALAAVSAEGATLTYRQLEDYANLIGGHIPARSLVFCFCKNVIGSMAGYLSFLRNRIVPLMVDAAINETLAGNLMEVYKPQYLYLPSELAEKYKDMDTVCSQFDYTLLKTNYDKAYPLNDELGLLLTTSGSTGSPKLVRQDRKSVV